MDIGQKIRQLRTQNNLTLEELASRSELTKGFLSQVERNLTSPSVSTLEDILEALGTDLASFFKDSKMCIRDSIWSCIAIRKSSYAADRGPGNRKWKTACIRWRRYLQTSILMSGSISGDMMYPMTGTGGKNKLIIFCSLWYRDLFIRSFFSEDCRK